MIWSIAVLLLLLHTAEGQVATTSPEEILTLEHALELALRHNQHIHHATLEVDKAAARVAAMRTRRLPTLKVGVTGLYLLTPIALEFERGAFGTFAGIGPVPDKDTSIRTSPGLRASTTASVSQPLSQLYRIGLSIEQLEANQHLTREQLRAQRHAVIHDIKRLYYTMLQTQSAMAAATEALTSYRELQRVVDGQVAQQVALRADSLEVKSRLAKTDQELLALRHALAGQQEQLNEWLGRDIRTAFRLSPVPETTAFETDLARAQALALQQRPEVRMAQLKTAQAAYDVRLKAAEYIPDVSVGFNYLSPVTGDTLPRHITYVGLEFSWELYDWGRKRAELTERRKTLAQAHNEQSHTEPQILRDVNARWRTLQETRALLQVRQLEQETAQEKLRVATQKYSQHAALLQAVLQAQATLAEATHHYQQTLLDLWTARAAFEKALGAGEE